MHVSSRVGFAIASVRLTVSNVKDNKQVPALHILV